jgi:uncharacterized protein YegL
MTKSNYTHIAFLLDRSGSMQSIKDDAIGGFNELVTDQAKAPGECTLTLVQFDSQNPQETVYDKLPIGQVPELTAAAYVPRGGTPLLDAVGRLIVTTGEQLASLPEHERPEKVIIVILTDGLENASLEYTREQVFDLITHQRETYSWEFIFLGANQDAIAEGVKYGIAVARSRTFDTTAEGTRAAYIDTSGLLRQIRSSGTSDEAGSIGFSPRRV